ncbi:hypothetical protein DVH24_041622 [Malus domestica]|uniref:Uncharacterized protein n=1 Tax=Malus domestica TaxID=3750 RepID=A0A498IRN8_MALDO|nr:hypothetical protein DVH24_041622 [Malus domestica]
MKRTTNSSTATNDEGIHFVEAQVLNCTLSDVLKNPNLAQLNKFFSFELENYHNEIPGGVQLNMFQCGGFAIGQCVSHKLADGLSNFVFTNTWAATARRDQADIDPPQFVSAALFPPPKEFNLGSGGSMPLTKAKVTRRFICNASEIETLRAKYQRNTKNVPSKRPSRVETLTAFIWNRFVGLQRVALRINCTTVNLRPRFDPPLPQNTFGNIFHIALTSPLQILSNSSDDEECDDGAVQD